MKLFVRISLVLLSAVPMAQAQLLFTTNSGAITITGCSSSMSAMLIPGATNGFPITGIAHSAFQLKTGLTSATISSGVTSIGYEVFIGCSGLTNVSLPDSVTHLGNQAFYNCPQLTTVTLPHGLTNLGYGTFYSCASLAGVTIGNNLTVIGNSAFFKCLSLTNVNLPASVTSIGSGVFYDCASLTAITVDPANSFYRSVNGVLFDKSQATLIQYPCGLAGSYAVPGTVTSIAPAAFGDSSNLTSVTIPASVTSIGNNAFSGCPNLSAVYFLGNAPAVGSGNFSGHTNLTVYYLPGTTGWGPTYDSAPTKLWDPHPQTGDGSFGVQAGQFGFNLTGGSNLVIVVEACTNLSHPDWQPVSTNTLTGGSSYFSDPHWTDFPGRFYRLRSP